MADIHTVIDSYADLLARHPTLYRRFLKRWRENRESVLAEAVTFSVLQQCGVRPEIADQLNRGGPDFRCAGIRGEQFMVEATSFEPDKVTKNTSIENDLSPGLNGHAYALLTRQLEEKAGSTNSSVSHPGDSIQPFGIFARARCVRGKQRSDISAVLGGQ